MVLEGVNLKLRYNFKVVRVNGQSDSLGRFREATSTVRILNADDADSAAAAADDAGSTPGGDLVVKDVPGLAKPVAALNHFLEAFGRRFRVAGERESCAFMVHGGHGTGKTLILERLAATGWGSVQWIQPGDKLSTIREVFKQATASRQPTIILIDEFQDLISKDRSNRDDVVRTLTNELDALSAKAKAEQRLPCVVVVATCLDYMLDVPVKLRRRSRFYRNAALPIPRAPERREILDFLNPPLREAEREGCLANIASRTHAFNGDDLACLVLNALEIQAARLGSEAAAAATEESGEMTEPPKNSMPASDMEQALKVTEATAMHDINLNPPTIHWRDVGGQDKLKKVLSRMIKNTKVRTPPPVVYSHHGMH